NGGFIETSAANVRIRDDVRVTTSASQGLMGTWLIDPQDFIIGPGGNISGATLSGQLVNNSITITTAPGPGNGDIFVNDAITWTAAGAPTTLTLNADRDVNINAAVTATNGNFVACCGRDVNVNAAMTTTNGSILLAAGRNVNQNAAITTNNGNLMMCAANDVNISAMITVTNGTTDASRSLGLPRGLTLSADTDGTGPGVAGGTVVFAPLTPVAAVTNAPVVVTYNPVSYTTPTDYSTKFTLTAGATLTQRMLVFPEVTKNFDGTTAAVLTTLKGAPAGVSLIAGSGATATFDNATAGTNKTVTFNGYTLGGANAAQYALASNCCGTIVQKTTGTIRPAIVPAIVPGVGIFNPDGSTALPYVELAMPALFTLASYRSGMMPTYMSDAGDVFFVTKEEEVAAPTVIPFTPPPPYIAPRYAPRPARN
ncbi:MAG: YDG domain-containing protein, partial [Acidovorax sp.]|nr:YDG domain-containing protein [Acidovorax sp.]